MKYYYKGKEINLNDKLVFAYEELSGAKLSDNDIDYLLGHKMNTAGMDVTTQIESQMKEELTVLS